MRTCGSVWQLTPYFHFADVSLRTLYKARLPLKIRSPLTRDSLLGQDLSGTICPGFKSNSSRITTSIPGMSQDSISRPPTPDEPPFPLEFLQSLPANDINPPSLIYDKGDVVVALSTHACDRLLLHSEVLKEKSGWFKLQLDSWKALRAESIDGRTAKARPWMFGLKLYSERRNQNPIDVVGHLIRLDQAYILHCGVSIHILEQPRFRALRWLILSHSSRNPTRWMRSTIIARSILQSSNVKTQTPEAAA